MTSSAFKFIPGPVGQSFIDDRKFVKIICGPVGGGKSTDALMELFGRSVLQAPFDNVRRTKHILMRNTGTQLKHTVKPLIDQWFTGMVQNSMGNWRLTDNVFEMKFKMPDMTIVHAEFCLMPADTPDDVRRLLSLEASSAWIEELREIDQAIYEGLQGRVARFPNKASGGVTYPGLIGSTNPPPMGSWLQELMSDPPSNTAIFMQPPAMLEDGTINPAAENLENLDDDYYANLIEGKSSDWLDVYMRNKFGAGGFGYPVFRNTFRRAFHVSETALSAVPASLNPIVVGMDNGLTAAAVIGQMDARGRLNILGESYVPEGETMGVETFLDRLLVPYLQARFPVRPESIMFVLDPACYQRSQVNEVTIAQAVGSRGYRTMRASTNVPERRIAAVEGLLSRAIDGGPGMLLSGPHTPWLTRALDYLYRNKKQVAGMSSATPEKNHASHICFAAGTMISTPYGAKAVETLRPGDMVVTPLGPMPVEAQWMSSDSAVVVEAIVAGARLTCTPEHPFYVSGLGFVSVDALQYQDLIVLEKTCGPTNTRFLSSTESPTTTNPAGTTKPATMRAGRTCTGRSTKKRTGLLARAFRFTTSTTTALTTLLKTLWRSLDATTAATTCCSGVASIRPLSMSTWFGREKPQGAGTSPTSDALGTASTQKMCGPSSSSRISSACDAPSRILHFHRPSKSGSAGQVARVWPARTATKTEWTDRVDGAVQRSPPTGTARFHTAQAHVQLRPLQRREAVYALSVQGCPMYFAEGVLVSNCDALQYLCLNYNAQTNPSAWGRRNTLRTVETRPFVYV